MEYSIIGNTDLRISSLSLGCMSLQGEGIEEQRIIGNALDAGINLFDTADLYQKGTNEKLLGKALKGRREEAIITTKVGNEWKADGSGWDWNPSAAYILKSVDDSLRRLQTDYIDLYLLHGGTIDDPTDETIAAFEQLKQHGKIRYYGISSIRPNVIKRWIERSAMSVVMMQYSLLDRRPEEICLELLQKHHIGIMARGTLAKGLLANKSARAYLQFSKDEIDRFQSIFWEKYQNLDSRIGQSLKFVLNHPAISTAVVGIRTQVQLNSVLKAIEDASSLDQDLQNLLPALQYQMHR